jgi:hypothetical protein
VLLIDDSRPDPLADIAHYVGAFREMAERGAMVVGIGRLGVRHPSIESYAAWLSSQSLSLPVFGVDVRRRDDVLLLLDALLYQIETSKLLADMPDA